jgi:hypothetical protein
LHPLHRQYPHLFQRLVIQLHFDARLTVSNRQTPAATETLRLSTEPRMGMLTNGAHAFAFRAQYPGGGGRPGRGVKRFGRVACRADDVDVTRFQSA